MIVLKFGGTSVADVPRMSAVCDIIRDRLDRRPVVVVSALAGVTDLLIGAVGRARAGDQEGLEPILADLERRHRWAVAGIVERPDARHDLALKVDSLFDELRQLFRSVRILRDATPRAEDALLAFGESLSSTILVAALRDRGVPAVGVDPRDVLITDDRHQAAEPNIDQVQRRAQQFVASRVEAGEVPVLGGFVGATVEGVTTTLGRGGSDTSASILGCALRAEEVQIWTDVDGLMSADPRVVPEARPLARLSFAEAAELAHYGARVLHPASIAPAVRCGIPVRILNTFRPQAAGTVVLVDEGDSSSDLVSIASRGGLGILRVIGRKMRMDPGLLLRILEATGRMSLAPDLVISSEVGVTLVLPATADVSALEREFEAEATPSFQRGRAILCVVGSGIARNAAARGRVLQALATLDPDVVALGATGTSATAVVAEERLDDAVREVHSRCFGAQRIP